VKRLGAAVLAAWAIHVGYHMVARHDTYDGLWTCNMACASLGVGCLLSSRRAVAVGTAWLTYGLPIWIIGLASGNDLVATSVVVHVGGVLAGTLAIRELGFPAGTWWRSTAWLVLLLFVTRIATPPHENVNLVFAVYRGWETLFPTWRGYFVFLLVTGTLTFAAVEATARKLLSNGRRRTSTPSKAIA
jgi:hypothetical protein